MPRAVVLRVFSLVNHTHTLSLCMCVCVCVCVCTPLVAVTVSPVSRFVFRLLPLSFRRHYFSRATEERLQLTSIPMESTLAFHAYAARSRRRARESDPNRATKVRAKVLMLHGYAMNARVFTTKTKTLAKKLSQRGFECVYLDAPFLLPMTSIVMVEGVPGKLGCALFALWFRSTAHS